MHDPQERRAVCAAQSGALSSIASGSAVGVAVATMEEGGFRNTLDAERVLSGYPPDSTRQRHKLPDLLSPWACISQEIHRTPIRQLSLR